jgi:hypothetical protein
VRSASRSAMKPSARGSFSPPASGLRRERRASATASGRPASARPLPGGRSSPALLSVMSATAWITRSSSGASPSPRPMVRVKRSHSAR